MLFLWRHALCNNTNHSCHPLKDDFYGCLNTHNIIIIAEVSTAHDMSDMYTDFLHIMNQHTTVLADTVSLDLTYFSNKFIECGFITQTAASDVLSKLGISAGHKSQELLHLARHNYEISLKKQVWADKFIAIFSSQAAYSDLAVRLRGDSSHTGRSNITRVAIDTVSRDGVGQILHEHVQQLHWQLRIP